METKREEAELESEALARQAAAVASEKQASDILLLDVRGMCPYADYLVLCSGETERQLQAISEGVDQAVAGEGGSLFRLEGDVDSGWVLLDFGNVVVHIFKSQERQFYRLEQLWSLATPLLVIQ